MTIGQDPHLQVLTGMREYVLEYSSDCESYCSIRDRNVPPNVKSASPRIRIRPFHRLHVHVYTDFST